MRPQPKPRPSGKPIDHRIVYTTSGAAPTNPATNAKEH